MAIISVSNCNDLTINNNTVSSINYTVVKLSNTNLLEVLTIDDVVLEDLTLAASTQVTYEALSDGLYGVSIDGADYELFILDCSIQECKLKLDLKYLCNTYSCEHIEYRKALYNSAKFHSLFTILYAKWNEWKVYRTIGSTSTGTVTKEMIYVNDLIQQLLRFCKDCGCDCGTETTYKSTDCGCNS